MAQRIKEDGMCQLVHWRASALLRQQERGDQNSSRQGRMPSEAGYSHRRQATAVSACNAAGRGRAIRPRASVAGETQTWFCA
jgi:hypothetical protein